jgi:hypothetical protein
MRHLEPNIKVNEMKGKNKPISLIFISLLVLSALLTVAYVPNAASSPGVSFDAKISPSVVSGVYPPLSTKFTINVTGLGTDSIDTVNITYPEGWTYVSAQQPTGWAMPTHNSTTRTVTFSNDGGEPITNGTWKLFNVTVKAASGFGVTNSWSVNCASGGTWGTAKTLGVYVTPWFDATITPNLKKANETLWFEVKVKNNASESSINIVKITYPDTDGWQILDYTGPTGWTYTYRPPTITFTAPSGYEIAKGSYAIFKFKMTTGTPTSPTTKNYNWSITCTNTLGIIAEMTPKVTIDNTKPTITVNAPTVYWYSVGSRNYIWLNITVSDDIKMEPKVKLNDTRFSLYSSAYLAGTTYNYLFCYRNNTAIPDGPLAVQVNVTDYVGNTAREYPKIVETTVDNTPPFIWITVTPATLIGSTFWIGKTQISVTINVTVADYELEPVGALTGIYINGTRQTGWNFASTGKKYKGYNVFECSNSYTVLTDKNYWIIYVNVTDMARPKNHTSEMTVYIKRDLVPPHEIGFTTVKPICGGLVIYGLYAKDNVGIYDYIFEVNGTTTLLTLTQEDLESDSWTGNAFAGVVVLDLTGYPGQFVNITVLARDYGQNPGAAKVIYAGTVPQGLWYPIELYKGWNLISLPLVPANSSISSVLSLLLKEGLLESVWAYDAETKTWHSYAPGAPPDLTTMVDGKGYFIKVKAYNVLIVQGTEQPAPPATPRVYHVVPGWNLIGYKRLTESKVSDYLSGVDYIRVYTFINGQYILVRPDENMEPGLGYWVAVKTEGWIYP